MTDEHGIVRNGSIDSVVNGRRDTNATTNHTINSNHTTTPSPNHQQHNSEQQQQQQQQRTINYNNNDTTDSASVFSSGHSDQSRSPIDTTNRNSGEQKILTGIGNGSSANNKLPNNNTTYTNSNNNINNNVNNGTTPHNPVGGRLQFFKGMYSISGDFFSNSACF